MTQAELAEATGFAQDRISNYENGRRPLRLNEMRVLARGLGCTPADLLDDSDNPDRLSADERALVARFREAEDAQRAMIQRIAEPLQSEEPGQVRAYG